MYEASAPGRREWSPIPDQFVLKEIDKLTRRCWQRGPMRFDGYLAQLSLGRWLLAPTVTIRKAG